MKNLQDNEFERLNHAVSLDNDTKDKMRSVILKTSQKQKKYFFPKVLSALLIIFIVALSYTLITKNSPEQITTVGEIIDTHTPKTLPNVQVTDNMYTIEWLSDSMDRGNHDLQTDVHGKLVVSKGIQPIKRGDILYYQVDHQNQIGRVIGLAGETVEIRAGQVYIDGKKLNTFYGVATSLGLTKDDYFKRVNKENSNLAAMEEYFRTSMEPVVVGENMVFVLVDMWWRGKDSREFGAIPFNQLQGKVLGYEEPFANTDTNPVLDINFVEANAEIGLTKKEVKEIFGDNFFSGKGEVKDSEVWVYDRVKDNYEYEKSIQIVQFDAIKEGNVEYQLYINFRGDESFMYLFFYRGDDGKLWQYEVTPDGNQKKQD